MPKAARPRRSRETRGALVRAVVSNLAGRPAAIGPLKAIEALDARSERLVTRDSPLWGYAEIASGIRRSCTANERAASSSGRRLRGERALERLRL